MNAHARIVPSDHLSNAYERERDYSRRVELALARALFLLRIECNRRAERGEDASHIRKFIEEAPL